MYAHKYGVKKPIHLFALGLRSSSSVPSVILKYGNTTQTISNVSSSHTYCISRYMGDTMQHARTVTLIS